MKKTVAMVLSILLVTGNIAGFEINAQDNFVLGDVNQDNTINAIDAARVLVASASIGSGQESGLTDTETVLADYNQDGTVNALDASGILVYSAEVGAGLLKETKVLPTHSYLAWTKVGDMTSHSDFRAKFNGITTPDANDTLYTFLFKHYDFDTTQLTDAIQGEYTDLGETDADGAIWNTMFELLPSDSTTFNGDNTLTRGQAMALVMRAITPVESDGVPNSNSNFTNSVGSGVYTDYASYMDKNVFISSNSGLTEENFNTPMTRGEYIYLLINAVYGRINVPIVSVEFNDCKDGGIFDDCSDNEEKLTKSLANPDENGVPSGIYYALVNANQKGIINNDTHFDESITLTDAVDLLSNAIMAKGEQDNISLPQEVLDRIAQETTESPSETTTEEITTTTVESSVSSETTTTVATTQPVQQQDPVQQEEPVQQQDNTPVVEQPVQNDPEPVYVEPVQTNPPVVETQAPEPEPEPVVIETQAPEPEPEPVIQETQSQQSGSLERAHTYYDEDDAAQDNQTIHISDGDEITWN